VQAFFKNLKRKIPFENLLDVKRAAGLRLFGYLLFVAIFAGVLIFYKFPYESLENNLAAIIAERFDLKLDVTDLRPALPPKLKFNQFSVRKLDYQGQLLFYATEGYLRPRILPLFGGKFAVAINAKAYGGSLIGDVILKPFYNVRNYRLEASWQAIQLQKHSGLRFLLERQVSGEFSGDFRLNGSLKELANSSGVGELRLTKGSFPIEYPYLKVKILEGLEVSASFKLNGGKLKINNGRFQAEGFDGTLKGIVQLQSRLYESVIDISGQSQIDPALLNFTSDSNKGLAALLERNMPLPFRLRGTLAEPKLTLF
jgi:type II secretion system protein N